MRGRVGILTVLGAAAGGLIGAALSPPPTRVAVGIAAGGGYAAFLAVVGGRVAGWLRRGSPEREAGVLLGGVLGGLAGGVAGMAAAAAWFLPASADMTAATFATGLTGAALGGPTGFAAGGLVGGLLVGFYGWADARVVAPLRAKAVVVETAVRFGAVVGGLIDLVILALLAYERTARRHGKTADIIPTWVAVVVWIGLGLGLFWAARKAAGEVGRRAVGAVLQRMAVADRRHTFPVPVVGFLGRVVGFLIGAIGYALGWKAPPPTTEPSAKPRARPGWWRKSRRGG